MGREDAEKAGGDIGSPCGSMPYHKFGDCKGHLFCAKGSSKYSPGSCVKKMAHYVSRMSTLDKSKNISSSKEIKTLKRNEASKTKNGNALDSEIHGRYIVWIAIVVVVALAASLLAALSASRRSATYRYEQ